MIFVIVVAIFALSCTNNDTTVVDNQYNTGNDTTKKVILTDATGKKWDITHAVEKYGWKPGAFRYGLGVNAITPISEPGFLSPGDAGYPAASATFSVIGLELNGESRAYPLNILNGHEVVNDQFGRQYVAVTY